uniref:hypothetical protein n=1 Tax=Klebsiella aerogenes TaxID=548 RepID=UPI0013D62AB4
FLLGLHASFWAKTSRQLRISEDDLKYIRPKAVVSMKLMMEGESDPPFTTIRIPNPNNRYGVLAMNHGRKTA